MATSIPTECKLILASIVLIVIGLVLASVIGAEVGVYTLWLGFITGVLGLGLLIILRFRQWVSR